MLTPEQVNNAVVLTSLERGRQIGRLIVELDEDGNIASYAPDLVNLNSSIPDDPELGQQLRTLKSQVP